jgi:dihydrofolate reductase
MAGGEAVVGRIVVTEFVSLDGVIEDPGGAEDFEHGGWSFEISRGEEGDRFKLDETMASEALLLGRRTYEGFADAWPSRDGEFADKFNSMPKYVVSSALEDPEWTEDLVDALRLMAVPIVLGTGKRLFGETSDKKGLRLVDSKVVGDGVAILIYQPARS